MKNGDKIFIIRNGEIRESRYESKDNGSEFHHVNFGPYWIGQSRLGEIFTDKEKAKMALFKKKLGVIR